MILNLESINNDKYLQKSWNAMEKIFTPHYCNIVMGKLEKEILARFPHKKNLEKILGWYFMIWEHDHKRLEEFLYLINSDHPTIKFMAEVHENSGDFLDATIHKRRNCSATGTLSTKIRYFKATDTHSLSLKTSFYPKHVFCGLIKSQILRYYRNCTENRDFDTTCSTLFNVLRGWSYSFR